MTTFAFLSASLSTCAGLPETLTLETTILFIKTAADLKRAIVQGQTLSESLNPQGIPNILPGPVREFLSARFQLSVAHVDGCWSAFKETIWMYSDKDADADNFTRCWDYGSRMKRKLSARMLFPPMDSCVNPRCGKTKLLRSRDTLPSKVVCFTLAGAFETYSVRLYCRGCLTNYHPNYSVSEGVRTYYQGIPEMLQVSAHKFVAQEVVELFTNLMLMSWTSATNAARVYNISLSKHYDPSIPAKFELGMKHVWDSFVLLALLEDHNSRDDLLYLPHDGTQTHRFTEAMKARNLRMLNAGQPEWAHYCERCCRRWEDGDGGTTRKLSVIVTDGVTIGHPCCGDRHCTEELVNNRDHFCSKHHELAFHCVVEGCEQKAQQDYQTCAIPSHRELEVHHKKRDKAMFQLKGRLVRAKVSHPNDSITPEVTDDNMDDCPEKLETGNRKLRALFGRRRTHNEQIIVRPCGIIVARSTFYGSETVPQTADFIKKTFAVPGSLPDICFYDSNCLLYQHCARIDGETLHLEMGLPVDVFHHESKHTQTTEACAVHCNPAVFDELKRPDAPDKWYFNSSIAEQTNVWLGGYHAILREMGVHKYNFFLDEMIMRKNRFTRTKLEKDGHIPSYIPGLSFAQT